MATSAPKPAAKTGPKPVTPPDAAEAPPLPKKSRGKLILLGLVAVLVLGGAGGAAWFFLGRDAAGAKGEHAGKHEPAKPPVFVNLDPFTVNLAREASEQFLQAALTIQVEDQAQVELMKLYMPLARSRLLLLLSSKKASEIATPEGKQALSEEVLAQLKLPFAAGTEPQKITGVFFTSFVIQ